MQITKHLLPEVSKYTLKVRIGATTLSVGRDESGALAAYVAEPTKGRRVRKLHLIVMSETGVVHLSGYKSTRYIGMSEGDDAVPFHLFEVVHHD